MIEKIPFGRTGHSSSRILFGGAALWEGSQEWANQTLDLVMASGVNHIDTAASYGMSETLIGPWLQQHRDKFFLASKTGERTYQKAKEEIHRSLARLHTDHLDLIQLHNLVDSDEWAVALGSGGALEAAVEAQEQGLVRFIGVTGHGLDVPRRHIESLNRFPFHSVLLPYNYRFMENPQYAADFNELMGICTEREVAVQAIKTIARGRWKDKVRTRNTWYEPLEQQEEIDAAVHWAMSSQPHIFLNSAGDVDLLPRVLKAGERANVAKKMPALSQTLSKLATTPLFTPEIRNRI
jgi:aryl-alcohol dehydrogenase-like predicted oxidoreductase